MTYNIPVVSILACSLLTGGIIAADEPAVPQPQEEVKVDPQAVAILKRAADHLAAAKQFSVAAEIWEDTELEEGGRVQFTRLVEVKVRRPDHVQMNVRTSVPKRSFYYDGKAFSLLDQQKGFYGQVSAPATIDETLDKMERDYGIAFPIEDILVSKPFGNGAQNAQSAQYLGIEPVLGVNCHHLAFQYEAIDWQAWIEDGPVAVVRKVVITSKSEENAPQLTALLSNWDFTTLLPDFIFAFDPPLGSAKIEVLLAKEAGTDAKPSK